MKKLFLTMALVLGMFAANAQVWIGGGFGAQIQKDYTKFSIAPEVGGVISDHWHVGLGANYTFAKDTSTANSLIVEPYVRYVATIIDDKFALFFDLVGDFGLIDASGWATTLRPGIAWFATKRWTAAFCFASARYDHGLYGSDNGFNLNCDLAAPHIRLYYNF